MSLWVFLSNEYLYFCIYKYILYQDIKAGVNIKLFLSDDIVLWDCRVAAVALRVYRRFQILLHGNEDCGAVLIYVGLR